MQARKTFRRILTIALTLALAVSSALAAAATAYPFTTVTTDQVNMRRSASSTATVLERVDKGSSIEVLGASGNYYKISYNNRTGYVLKQYVDLDSAVTPEPTIEVDGHGLSLRDHDEGQRQPAGEEVHQIRPDSSDSRRCDNQRAGRFRQLCAGGVQRQDRLLREGLHQPQADREGDRHAQAHGGACGDGGHAFRVCNAAKGRYRHECPGTARRAD